MALIYLNQHLPISYLLFHSPVLVPDQMVMDDPAFRQDDRYFLSTEEAFDSAMKKSIHYIKKTKDLTRLERNIFLK